MTSTTSSASAGSVLRQYVAHVAGVRSLAAHDAAHRRRFDQPRRDALLRGRRAQRDFRRGERGDPDVAAGRQVDRVRARRRRTGSRACPTSRHARSPLPTVTVPDTTTMHSSRPPVAPCERLAGREPQCLEAHVAPAGGLRRHARDGAALARGLDERDRRAHCLDAPVPPCRSCLRPARPRGGARARFVAGAPSTSARSRRYAMSA